ncbi:MAG: hypothetical protein AMXMBFR59_28980 [Rhodanobacteraceae bacterium]
MDTIRDADLILYHYRDGLSAADIAAIERALAASESLRARYEVLLATLEAVDAQPAPEPADGFEQRLWQRWEQRVDTQPPAAHGRGAHARAAPRASHRAGMRRLPRYAAMTLALVAAVGVGFLLGRQPGDPRGAPAVGASPALASHDMAARVLDAYVASHLRETEGVVLTAVNSDNATLLAGNRELAAGLLESNRLYALAAARAGNTRLASFLQQLEPVLIELANPVPTEAIQGSDGLRDYVDKTDLLFQLRATQARIEPQRPTSI